MLDNRLQYDKRLGVKDSSTAYITEEQRPWSGTKVFEHKAFFVLKKGTSVDTAVTTNELTLHLLRSKPLLTLGQPLVSSVTTTKGIEKMH